MKILLFISIALILLAIVKCVPPTCQNINPNALILNTLNGQVNGICYNNTIYYASKLTSSNNPVLNWLGIPYAKPPVGSLRWKDPVQIGNWSQAVNGMIPSFGCIQPPFVDNSVYSEDCLYLNIYSPYNAYVNSVLNKDSTKLLPIYVWIHGGAFILGSGNDFDGSVISTISNMIVVTINYRLGAFGSFYLPNVANLSGNQALRDQNLALKWIYTNAATFGGDKTRITIGGESAGSWSVGYQLVYKDSWPYFNQAIMQSGNPVTLDIGTNLLSKDQATAISKSLGSQLKCTDQNNLLACLQNKSYADINSVSYLDVYPQFPKFVLDPNVFDSQPKQLFQNGNFKQCKIIVGSNNYEEYFLAPDEIGEFIQDLKSGKLNALYGAIRKRLPFSSNQTDSIIKQYVPSNQLNSNSSVDFYAYFNKIVTDYQYRCPANFLADYYSQFNNTAYAYMYAQKSVLKDWGVDGAVHADDIDTTWGNYLLNNQVPTTDRLFTEKIINYWGSFINNSMPSLNNEWPKFKTENNSNRNLFFLKYNQTVNTVININETVCQFWNNLRNSSIKSFNWSSVKLFYLVSIIAIYIHKLICEN